MGDKILETQRQDFASRGYVSAHLGLADAREHAERQQKDFKLSAIIIEVPVSLHSHLATFVRHASNFETGRRSTVSISTDVQNG